MLTRAVEEQPRHIGLRSSLVAADVYWAKMLAERWQFRDAATILRSAADQCRDTILLATGRYMVAGSNSFASRSRSCELEALDLNHDLVARRGTQLLEQSSRDDSMRNLSRTSPRHAQLLLTSLIAESLLAREDHETAVRLCDGVLVESADQLQDHQDHRTLSRALAAVQTKLAQCQLALGKLDDAESNARSAMQRYRHSFVYDGTPKAVFVCLHER